jgi:hypothetical protein
LLHILSPQGKLVHWGLKGLAAKNNMQQKAKLNPDIAEWFKIINKCTASGADVVVNPYDNDYTSVQRTLTWDIWTTTNYWTIIDHHASSS